MLFTLKSYCTSVVFIKSSAMIEARACPSDFCPNVPIQHAWGGAQCLVSGSLICIAINLRVTCNIRETRHGIERNKTTFWERGVSTTALHLCYDKKKTDDKEGESSRVSWWKLVNCFLKKEVRHRCFQTLGRTDYLNRGFVAQFPRKLRALICVLQYIKRSRIQL